MIDRPKEAEAREAVAVLAALVVAPSVNPPGDTTGPAAVAEAFLRAAGLPCERVARDPVKPNLVSRVENGAGPHLVLNAHLDTVPPGDLAAWTVPPFALTERKGRLHGLGAGNMKAAAAAMLLALRRLDQARHGWRGTVTLTLVSDECVFGPDGAAYLLDARSDVLGDWLLCGEGPGGMHLAVAEKGLMWVRLQAEGRVGQGMLTDRGTSAPARLAAALLEIDGWNALRAVPPDAALDHPGNAEGQRLSANIGRIEGGGGFSQAVHAASAQIDFRLPPGMRRADLAARLDALPGVCWQEAKGWEPNASDSGSPLAQAVSRAAEAVRGAAPLLVTRLPASDAARWRACGVPAVCYGPQPELASGVDDHVRRADLLDCIAIYARSARHLLAPATAE